MQHARVGSVVLTNIVISCVLRTTAAQYLPIPSKQVRQDHAKAEALYLRAVTLEPQHANSIYNYAVLLDSGLGDAARAEAMYRRCLAAAPKHSYALYNLAVLVEEQATEVAFLFK
jgi:tetratricopeptide (TPR) repeat protein